MFKKLKEKWKEINTEGYEWGFSLEIDLVFLSLIIITIIGLLWIVFM